MKEFTSWSQPTKPKPKTLLLICTHHLILPASQPSPNPDPGRLLCSTSDRSTLLARINISEDAAKIRQTEGSFCCIYANTVEQICSFAPDIDLVCAVYQAETAKVQTNRTIETHRHQKKKQPPVSKEASGVLMVFKKRSAAFCSRFAPLEPGQTVCIRARTPHAVFDVPNEQQQQ